MSLQETVDRLVKALNVFSAACAGLAVLFEGLMSLDQEPVEIEETTSWPYGGRQLNMVSCDGCGFLTCHCEEIDTELTEMTP